MTLNKILIIGPSWVGDMVMAQCLFKLLKQQYPALQLHVLSPAWTFSLLSRMPEVDCAIEMPITHGELKLKQRYQLAKKLRLANYDQAIVLANSLKAALIPWLARIPKRTGYKGEFRYGLINDMRYINPNHSLMIEQYMALGRAANAVLPTPYPLPSFSIAKASQQQTLNALNLTLPAKPILALCAGAEFGPSKRWPAAYYAQVAKVMLEQGWVIWLFGSPKDKVITDEIMQLTQDRCINIAGRPVLAQTIDLLSLVTGVVTNDSGLMHVASALDKKYTYEHRYGKTG